MTNTYTNDMTKGNPVLLLLKFTLPMLVGNLFQQLYNLVDAIVVGNYVGEKALGAVGVTGSLVFLFFSLTFGLSVGVGIMISRFFGSQEEKKLRKTIASSFYVMGISAIIMSIVGVLFARPALQLLNTPTDILEDAVLYMRVTCLGLIAVAAYNGIAAILRGLGNTMIPLVFLIAACVINILLDVAFVKYLGIGVLGVAYATIIAQGFAAVGCMLFAWKKINYFRMPLKDLVPDMTIVKNTLKVGIPVALQNAMISVSCIVLQKVVNDFGTTIVTAFTAQNRVEQLVQQPFNSLGAAIATFTGQNIGARDMERVRKGFWAGTFISTIFALLMIPISWIFAESIMRLFTDSPQVIIEGARGIRITSLFYVPLGMIYVTRNVLNGSGDANFAMFSGAVEVAGRMGFAYPLTLIPGVGVLAIWFTTGLTWTMTAGVSCIRYGGRKWQKKVMIVKEEISSRKKTLKYSLEIE